MASVNHDGLRVALYVESVAYAPGVELRLSNRPNALGVHVLLPQPSPEQLDELRVIADAVADAGFDDTCLRRVIEALSLTPVPSTNPEVALLEQAAVGPVDVWRWPQDVIQTTPEPSPPA